MRPLLFTILLFWSTVGSTYAADVTVYYKNGYYDLPYDEYINPRIMIRNNSASSLDLNTIVIDYLFYAPQTPINTMIVSVCCFSAGYTNDVTISRTKFSRTYGTGQYKADDQLRLGFRNHRMIAPGCYAVVEIAAHTINWWCFDETNDWSYRYQPYCCGYVSNPYIIVRDAASAEVLWGTLPGPAPQVQIDAPQEGFITTQSPIAVAWSVDGSAQTTQLTEPLVEGSNRIVRSFTNELGVTGSDTVSGILDQIPPLLQITAPPDSFATNQPLCTLGWTVDGIVQTTQLTENLVEGPNTIIRSAVDSLGNTGFDTITVFFDTLPPVVTIIYPGRDTIVTDSTIMVRSLADGQEYDSTLHLTGGIDTVIITHADAAGNSAHDTIRILYTAGIDSLFIQARAPDTAFTYQNIFLDGWQCKGPEVLPLQYVWRQVRGDPVFMPDSLMVLNEIMTRDDDTLAFELALYDTSGFLEPVFDTVIVRVVWPQNSSDYLKIMDTKNAADKGQKITITSPDMEPTFFTTVDTITISGTLHQDTSYGTIYWSSYSDYGTSSGSFPIAGPDWGGLKIPLENGDNLVLLVYTKNGETAAADRILVCKGSRFAVTDVVFDPDAFWIDSLMQHRVYVKLAVEGIDSMNLVRISDQETVFTTLNDNGDSPDSVANDSIYTGVFSLTARKDSSYHFRIKAYHQDSITHSSVYSFYSLYPYSDSLHQLIVSIYTQADSLYYYNKSIMDSIAAMNMVVDWLMDQDEVHIADIGPGRNSICWRYRCGVHAMIGDAPEGTKGGGKQKVKGLSPYFWDFDQNNCDEGTIGQSYDQLKMDSLHLDVDSLLYNPDYTDQNISIEDFKNWGSYKTIIVSTHGTTFGYFSKTQERKSPEVDPIIRGFSFWKKPYLCLRSYVVITSTLDSLYWRELVSPQNHYPRMIYHDGEYALTPKFFKEHGKNLNSSLIYTSACRTLWNDDFWDVFKSNGARAMLGYTDYVGSCFAADMGRIVYRDLVKGNTLKHAMDCARDSADWIFGGWPADGPDSVLAARFEYRGDSDFVLFSQPIYHRVDLQADLVRTAGVNTRFVNIGSRYDPSVFGDSVLVEHAAGDTVPLRQTASEALNIRRSAGEDSSNAVFTINSPQPLHGTALYLSTNTFNVSDDYWFNPVAAVTVYFTDTNNTAVQWSKDLHYIQELGNNVAAGAAVNRYEPTDPNSVQIHEPHDSYNWYMDLLKIPFPQEYHTATIDSVKIDTEYLFTNLGGGVFIYGGLRIHAMSVEAMKE